MVGLSISGESAVATPINVKNANFNFGEKGKQTVEAVKNVAAETAEKVKATVEYGKQAASLLKGSEETARSVMWLFSGSRATVEALSNQKKAEKIIVNAENISERVKQEKFEKIDKKYHTLTEYAANRKEITKKNIEKMKKSKDPEQQALGFDTEIATIKVDINYYDGEIKKSQANMDILKEQSGGNLSQEVIKEYEIIIKDLEAKKSGLSKKLEGEGEKEGLKAQREKIKAKDGSVILNIVEETAVALTSGEKEAMDKNTINAIRENPATYIENKLADALTDDTKMNELVANLEKDDIKLINGKKEREEFLKFMKLGLSAEEKRAMAAKLGGKGLLGLSGILGLFAYLSWKKSQEGGQQQMG